MVEVASAGPGFYKDNLRQKRHGGAHLEKPKKISDDEFNYLAIIRTFQ